MSNIVNSKIRFVRNLKGCPFNTNTNSKALNQVLNLSIDACQQCGLKAEMLNKISDEVIDNLVGSNMLEQDFVRDKKFLFNYHRKYKNIVHIYK